MPASAVDRLLDHYRRSARDLPWRAVPGAAPNDPYVVWLSEVMLQQTTVATVIPRFRRFVERWPTVEALAAASDEEILGEWAGLGYYARVRNLIACARAVAEQGGFPRHSNSLRMLPGIGDYTAAAIAAIAFGEQAAAVDTNVERVIARIHGIADRKAVRAAAAAMVPAERPGDYTQALMDLGAAICRPRNPDCPACPLAPDCAAFALGRPEDFPAPKAKRPRPHRHGVAEWHERDGALFIVRRPERGLLGGMAALPGGEWIAAAPPPTRGLMATVRHGFTHFTLDLHVVRADRPPAGPGWWQPLETLGEAGLPTLYRRAVGAALERRHASP
jgi:A/G-specific adenine glycosylase